MSRRKSREQAFALLNAAREVGVNCLPGNFDAALISLFDSPEDLETYKKDPRHVAVSQLCKSIRTDRVAVDMEV